MWLFTATPGRTTALLPTEPPLVLAADSERCFQTQDQVVKRERRIFQIPSQQWFFYKEYFTPNCLFNCCCPSGAKQGTRKSSYQTLPQSGCSITVTILRNTVFAHLLKLCELLQEWYFSATVVAACRTNPSTNRISVLPGSFLSHFFLR